MTVTVIVIITLWVLLSNHHCPHMVAIEQPEGRGKSLIELAIARVAAKLGLMTSHLFYPRPLYIIE